MLWPIGILAVVVLVAGIYFGGVGGMTAILLVLVFLGAAVVIKYLPPSRREPPAHQRPNQ